MKQLAIIISDDTNQSFNVFKFLRKLEKSVTLGNLNIQMKK